MNQLKVVMNLNRIDLIKSKFRLYLSKVFPFRIPGIPHDDTTSTSTDLSERMLLYTSVGSNFVDLFNQFRRPNHNSWSSILPYREYATIPELIEIRKFHNNKHTLEGVHRADGVYMVYRYTLALAQP